MTRLSRESSSAPRAPPRGRLRGHPAGLPALLGRGGPSTPPHPPFAAPEGSPRDGRRSGSGSRALAVSRARQGLLREVGSGNALLCCPILPPLNSSKGGGQAPDRSSPLSVYLPPSPSSATVELVLLAASSVPRVEPHASSESLLIQSPEIIPQTLLPPNVPGLR